MRLYLPSYYLIGNYSIHTPNRTYTVYDAVISHISNPVRDDTFQLGLISQKAKHSRSVRKKGTEKKTHTQRFHQCSFGNFTRICLSLMFYLSDFRLKKECQQSMHFSIFINAISSVAEETVKYTQKFTHSTSTIERPLAAAAAATADQQRK